MGGSVTVPKLDGAGSPLFLRAWSAATISASIVVCDTAFRFLLCAESGKKLCGPYRARCTPEMLLTSALSPARSASGNKPSCWFSGLSPTKPICRHDTFPLMYLIIRNRFRSHISSQRVIIVVNAPTARSRSCLASRAMYIISIKHVVVLWAILQWALRSQLPHAGGCVTTSGSLDSLTKGVGAVPISPCRKL